MLCVDYSDFNMTHQVSSRSLLSSLIAEAYKEKHQPHAAAAAAWMAAAHWNHTVDGTRVMRGLSSGERDTARDNTMLHTAYARMASLAIGPQGQEFERAFFRCCGDDEVAIGLPWAVAVSYVLELEAQGHAIQMRKIMLAEEACEFLQYNMFRDGRMPQQPLCPAIINAVSGSWYKSAAYDKATIATQAAGAFSGLIRRGVQRDVAQKLCISCCSWLASDMPWRTQLAATDLFGRQKDKPHISTNVSSHEVTQVVPQSRAARDYVAWLESQYPKLLPTTAEKRVVSEEVDLGIYGGAVAVIRETGPVPEFPDIDRIPAFEHGTAPDARSLCSAWLAADLGPREEPIEHVAYSCGLPTALIKKLGLPAVLRAIPNHLRARLNTHTSVSLPVKSGFRHLLPGALESAFV